MGRCTGAFAEHALMDAREAIAMPANLSWEEAGSVPLAFMVVHDMLIAQGKLKSGNGCSSPASRRASASPRCKPPRRWVRR